MTPKEKIKKYMEKKSEYLSQYLSDNMKFYVKADFDDVEKWSEECCETIWIKFLYKITYLRRGGKFWASDFCPHCHCFDEYCDTCPYAKRHGVCDDSYDNTFGLLSLRLETECSAESLSDFCVRIINEIEEGEK